MRGMNSECIDLVYLDPPFNSNADYAAPIGSQAAGAAFKDTWSLADVDAEWINLIESKHTALYRVLLAAMTDSDKSYLAYMAIRLLEVHRVMKPTGSVYLHCDPTMSHYLKLVMDAIFGNGRFVNEISWHRSQTRSSISRKFRSAHDVILFYGRSDKRHFQMQYRDLSDASKSLYNRIDERGHYQLVPLLVSGRRNGETGVIWRGIDPNLRGKNGMHWVTTPDNLDKYENEGRIFWPNKSGGVPRLKYYLEDSPGAPVDDFWHDISLIPSQSPEALGYPTQKPLALLNRIISASSNPGDVVLDPFCGCATTLVAADRLNRKWIGIDLSALAGELVLRRIREDRGPMFDDVVHRDDIPFRTDLGKIPRYNSPANRKALYGEQYGNCAGCNHHFEARHLEVDHIIPRSRGGTDHMGNLQLLCSSCNRIKGDRGMEYLKVKLQLR